MPILTTLRIGRPVWPFQSPLLILAAKPDIRSSTRAPGVRHLRRRPRSIDPWASKGDMQHCAVFRNVDLLAAEHSVDTLAQSRFLSEILEEPQGFCGDAVLGVIEEETGDRERKALASPGVIREQVPKMNCCLTCGDDPRVLSRPGVRLTDSVSSSDSRSRVGRRAQVLRASPTMRWASATTASRWAWSRKLSA